ncbi:MAG: hypothetical protein HQM13_08520 [SAR324 cluster bacterium]|nr:hypothetical protein [SAR324 cluster bacterium]
MRTIQRSWFFLFVSVFIFGMNAVAFAQTTASEHIPDELKQWIPWVLHGNEDHQCPRSIEKSDNFQCVWPSTLFLNINNSGGEFSQYWKLYDESWVFLPGSPKNWPQEVVVNQQDGLVASHQNRPALRLKAGTFLIQGKFNWENIPENLQVPENTGRIQLVLENRRQNLPDFDQEGRVWFKQRQSAESESEENQVEIKVFRKITDRVPMIFSSIVSLKIAGIPRELILEDLLPEDFIPLSLESELPAQLDKLGSLKIQVRAGEWDLQLAARSTENISEIEAPKSSQALWGQEVWVFEAQNHLRQVNISGVPAIDPTQTDLPSNWKHLPAYLVLPGQSIYFKEIKRGDPIPSPNQLTLSRLLWLDFEGRAYSFQDRIQGTINRNWNLSVNSALQLGRATIDGKDQLITVSKTGKQGVEIRQKRLNMVAEGRIEKTNSFLPISGWEEDFDRASISLRTPPGWKVWDISGVDQLKGTWIEQWTLLDLFLCFLIVLAIGKLWGWKWGVIAFLAIFLTYHEPDVPQWIWAHVILATVLYKVLPEGKLKGLFFLYRFFSLIALLLLALPFMLSQARNGLFPQLELDQEASPMIRQEALRPSVMKSQAITEMQQVQSAPPQKVLKRNFLKQSAAILEEKTISKGSRLDIDPNAQLQTGPGIPDWSWRSIEMQWKGPVEQGQTISLWITPPWINRTLSIVHTLLWALILFCLFELKYQKGKGFKCLKIPTWKKWFKQGTVSMILCCLFLISFESQLKAEFPSDGLLQELQDRLLSPPKCYPACLSAPQSHLEIKADQLLIELEIHALAHVLFPLPGNPSQWGIENAILDEKPIEEMFRDRKGQLQIPLLPGKHKLRLSGNLRDRDNFQINFPIRPYRIDVKSEGWQVEGIHQGRISERQIHLKRIKTAEQRENAPLETSDLPSFVKIERFIHLGLDWQIETLIQRDSPSQSSIILHFPLLPGESVTTGNIQVENGVATLQLTPQQKSKRIVSLLKQRDEIDLKASETMEWREVWKIEASPVWNLTTEGIPVIHQQNPQNSRFLEWHPWSGEQVKIKVFRPESSKGQQMTIDSSQLTVIPGKTSIKNKLRFRLRSSLGTSHPVKLPPAGKLQKVSINGRAVPIRQNGSLVELPIVPGSHEILIEWNEKNQSNFIFSGPFLDAGIPSVNATIQFQIPNDRWILSAGGPSLGPAVLFWGKLLILLIFAVALGKIENTPLNTLHWCLLALGFSTVDPFILLIFVAWVLAMRWRQNAEETIRPLLFNLGQIGLTLLTFAMFFAFYEALQMGLLGGPDMGIRGNHSFQGNLNWYQDQVASTLPSPWVLSIPLWVYRVAMLLWALWVALAMIKWLKWSWESYRTPLLWKPLGPFFWKKKAREDKKAERLSKSNNEN